MPTTTTDYFYVNASNFLKAYNNVPVGEHAFSVSATDGVNIGTQNVTITVQSAITSPTDLTATVQGTSVTLSFTLPDGIGQSATVHWYRSSVNPSSANFDPSNWVELAETDLSNNVITQ